MTLRIGYDLAGNSNVPDEKILWRDTLDKAFVAPPLEGDVSTDVVIIGGGFTGLSAALHLAEAGIKVCLVEADVVGNGGSGRNVGLVNAGLWLAPNAVETALGTAAGRKLNTALATAPQTVFDLIEKHGIECDSARSGTLNCALGSRGLRDLHDRYKQQSKYVADLTLLDAEETVRRTGSRSFAGSLFNPHAGTIQPYAYTHGLARAARIAGAAIHQNSLVVAMKRSGDRWEVRTRKGRIAAVKCIQATNAYGTRDVSGNAFCPIDFFQVATRPLPMDIRKSILPGGEGCWDTATIMTSFRLDGTGRLVVGGIGNLGGRGRQLHLAWAARKVRKLFAHLPPLEFEHAWTGRIAMTKDHLPKVVEIGENAISVFGYNGRGIGPGTIFGKAAAGWARSGDPNAFPVPIQPVTNESWTTAKGFCFETSAAFFHAIDAHWA